MWPTSAGNFGELVGFSPRVSSSRPTDADDAPRRELDKARIVDRRGGEDRRLSTALRHSAKEALARWVVRKRSPEQRWTRASDEACHEWTGTRHYAEDFTVVVVQPGLAVLARIEWLPGRASRRVWLTVLRDQVALTLPGGELLVPAESSGHWRAAGLELDCVAPYKEWRVRFTGRLVGARGESVTCRLDLTFLGAGAPYIPGTDDDPSLVARHLGSADWDLGFLRRIRRRRIRGYCQPGEAIGTIALDDQINAIAGASLRHHSWGERDWGAADDGYQGFFSLPGKDRLWVHHARFPWVVLEGGFVAERGALQPIAGIGVTRERQPGAAPRRIGLSVAVAGGERSLDAELRATTSLDLDGRGSLRFSLCEVAGGGWGLWIEQRRIDRRPRALSEQPPRRGISGP